MANVFFSYSHADEALRDELQKHLAVLKREGAITTWHDRRLLAGDNLDGTIQQNLEEADIVLLLVSKDFLASGYCYDIEFERAMERHRKGLCWVIPVILRPCDWKSTPIGGLVAVPKDGKPVVSWPDSDDAFLDITRKIREYVEWANGQHAPGSEVTAEKPVVGAAYVHAPRSSNLMVKKAFTEVQRDSFRVEGFEFIARFFESSLRELQMRNDGIETTFRRIDANRFTAAVYRNGNKAAVCTIQMGGISAGDIAYSNRDAGTSNGYNESISVGNDDQRLFFRSMGFRSMGQNQDKKLSNEGAAELFWEMLMEPLQR